MVTGRRRRLTGCYFDTTKERLCVISYNHSDWVAAARSRNRKPKQASGTVRARSLGIIPHRLCDEAQKSVFPIGTPCRLLHVATGKREPLSDHAIGRHR